MTILSRKNHGKILSHFSIAEDNGDIYTVGGDFTENDSNKIYKWNISNPQNFVEFTTLPEHRYGAGSIIENGNLYIFGGSSDKQLSSPSDKIYIIPLENPENIQEFSMGISMNETFVQKHEDLIIVAGSNNNNSIIGKFNVNTELFEEIEHNLETINPSYQIGQISVINESLYVLYGFVESLTPPGTGLNSVWSVLNVEL